jgi:hypothetical protein
VVSAPVQNAERGGFGSRWFFAGAWRSIRHYENATQEKNLNPCSLCGMASAGPVSTGHWGGGLKPALQFFRSIGHGLGKSVGFTWAMISLDDSKNRPGMWWFPAPVHTEIRGDFEELQNQE